MEIKSEEITIVRDREKIESFAVYDSKKVKDKDGKQELTLTKKASPKKGKFWRLVYKSGTKEIVQFLEAEGETVTPWDLFCGTREECEAEIKRLKLKASK